MLNKVQLIGRLGRDPEVRYSQAGDPIVNLSVATTETWRDKATGERREKTEWHRVVIFGKLAEIAGQYLKKGSLAYFEGKLQTRQWQDNDGQTRYTTEIALDFGGVMKMLGGNDNREHANDNGFEQHPQQRQAAAGGGAAPAPLPAQAPLDVDDDIPF